MQKIGCVIHKAKEAYSVAYAS